MNDPNGYRNDGVAKVTGQARYTDDLSAPGMLHAVPVYSELPRAKLVSIDASEALQQSGVLAVITARDIAGAVRFGQIIKDCTTGSDEKIDSAGDV